MWGIVFWSLANCIISHKVTGDWARGAWISLVLSSMEDVDLIDFRQITADELQHVPDSFRAVATQIHRLSGNVVVVRKGSRRSKPKETDKDSSRKSRAKKGKAKKKQKKEKLVLTPKFGRVTRNRRLGYEKTPNVIDARVAALNYLDEGEVESPFLEWSVVVAMLYDEGDVFMKHMCRKDIYDPIWLYSTFHHQISQLREHKAKIEVFSLKESDLLSRAIAQFEQKKWSKLFGKSHHDTLLRSLKKPSMPIEVICEAEVQEELESDLPVSVHRCSLPAAAEEGMALTEKTFLDLDELDLGEDPVGRVERPATESPLDVIVKEEAAKEEEVLKASVKKERKVKEEGLDEETEEEREENYFGFDLVDLETVGEDAIDLGIYDFY